MGTTKETEDLQCAAWELAKELVKIDSSDPGAYEGEIGRFVYEWLKRESGRLSLIHI